ncbi:MAG TPA: GNAT family N-acetyltransferase [Pyrinomonadaceae bacterium]|nr:GNAT family N-acetyltransferase [Pyrinomonadaceae bacterium]
MEFEIKEWPHTALEQYAAIPISFEVRSIFDVELSGANFTLSGANFTLSGANFTLSERRLDQPYTKDYDAIKGNNLLEWTTHFDLSNWGLLVAEDKGQLLGGVLLSFDVPEVEMFEGRRDLAVLWDIRVHPDSRGYGVGSALLRAAEAWARARGCCQLKIETQNINVPACRFYEQNGYVLTFVTPDAYPDLPEETQMLWYKTLRM